jgi:DNA-binding transcriptional ArsR family regulator
VIKKKGFRLKDADGQRFEIPAGEYYVNAKARPRRLMLNSLSSDARRVYACIELGTMAYRQEFAVIIEIGRDGVKRRRPLSPSDIARKTGLRKQNVGRALNELEQAGLIERRSDDGGALRNGHILIYSWAFPKPTKTDAAGDKGNGARPFPSWFPAEWGGEKGLLATLIKQKKRDIIADEVTARGYIEEGREAARSYQEGLEVAARFLDKICAPRPEPAHIKKETTSKREGPSQRNGAARPTSAAGKQAEPSVADLDAPEPACLPLSPLRDLFPKEFIDDAPLAELDKYFRAQLRERYTPEAYVEFVRDRQSSGGSFRAALALKRPGGLPQDFVRKGKQDAERHKILMQAEKTDGDARWKRAQDLARQTIADPTASEVDKDLARSVLGEEVVKSGGDRLG